MHAFMHVMIYLTIVRKRSGCMSYNCIPTCTCSVGWYTHECSLYLYNVFLYRFTYGIALKVMFTIYMLTTICTAFCVTDICIKFPASQIPIVIARIYHHTLIVQQYKVEEFSRTVQSECLYCNKRARIPCMQSYNYVYLESRTRDQLSCMILIPMIQFLYT